MLGRREWLAGALAGSALALRGASAGDTPTLRLTLTGQLLMKHALCALPYPGLDEVLAELRRSPVVASDLEVAIRTPRSGAPTREGTFQHAAEPAVLDCVQQMGFNLLALANNHAWDLGTAGVLATREAVAAAGLGHAGTGGDWREAAAVGTPPGHPEFGLVAMAVGKIREGGAATADRAGVNEMRMISPERIDPIDWQRNLDAIAAGARAGRFVVVCLHNHDWGSDMRQVRPWQREFAHACVDAGAGLFFSHGAPLLKGIELYHGRPLLHGLGSLVFHTRTEIGHYPPEVWESAIVHVEMREGALQRLEVVPVRLNEQGDDPERHLLTRGRPRLARDDDAERILERLRRLSADLGTTLARRGSRAFLTEPAALG